MSSCLLLHHIYIYIYHFVVVVVLMSVERIGIYKISTTICISYSCITHVMSLIMMGFVITTHVHFADGNKL